MPCEVHKSVLDIVSEHKKDRILQISCLYLSVLLSQFLQADPFVLLVQYLQATLSVQSGQYLQEALSVMLSEAVDELSGRGAEGNVSWKMT